MSDNEAASTALVHQPLTDKTGRVTAYVVRDLLPQQRPSTEDPTLDAEYEQADLPALSGGRPLLLQATRRVLTASSENVVALLPPGAAATAQVGGMVAWRQARGLATSLSGFTGTEPEMALLPMLAQVVVDAHSEDNHLGHLIDLVHTAGAQVVVERVRTSTELERAFTLGADLVEGRVLPEGELEHGGLAAGEMTCLELLRLLGEDPIDQGAVIGIIAADPNLAVGVLHLVNSAVFSLPRHIDSVRQAVVMVGPRLLRALAASSLQRAGQTDVDELWSALTRALACWELTGDDSGYTVGLLSAIADQRHLDPQWLAQIAGLSDQTTAALVAYDGPVGAALASIRGHELGDVRIAQRHQIDPHQISRIWLGSLPEALSIASALSCCAAE